MFRTKIASQVSLAVLAPSPYNLYQLMAYGYLVDLQMAPWKKTNGVWYRVGGHVVCLSHVYGSCGGATPNLGWKDPWTDDYIYNQSPFATSDSDMGGVTD